MLEDKRTDQGLEELKRETRKENQRTSQTGNNRKNFTRF